MIITEYIPQREPMVMIDNHIESTENYTVSSFNIQSDNIFVKDGFFHESGLIENIAQTAALRVGYFCKLNNTEVPVGFIGGIKALKINLLPILGESINTKVEILHQVFDATIIRGTVFNSINEICAECEMKIFTINN